MRSLFYKPSKAVAYCVAASLLAVSTVSYAQDRSTGPSPANSQQQDPEGPNGGWPQAGDSPNPYPDRAPDSVHQYGSPGAPPEPNQPNQPNQPYGGYGQQQYGQPAYGQGQQPSPIPAQLTIAPGTYVTVRLNQRLASDRNQRGDGFSTTLVEPLVVNGVVIAEPGQNIFGQVVEAQKVDGTGRLSVQLTDLSLVDGQRLPVQTQLIARRGDKFNGNDGAIVAGSTALGAAIGGAVGEGAGAAIGAGAGALVSLGAILTHGHASVLYPEQILTFRIEQPVSVVTANAPQAFHYVQPGEYERSYGASYDRRPGPGSSYAVTAPPPYYGYEYGYGYGYPYSAYGYGYPFYGGPSIGFYFGRGYYRGGNYYRGGYGGGRYEGGHYEGGHPGGGYRGDSGRSSGGHSSGGHGRR